ncbi:MAG TPA: hypothetical protein VJZ76_22530 [Thermoanaerobaculia bacterium]|nr:hypothetical protein [Thermoanaerobaculia bacterium]
MKTQHASRPRQRLNNLGFVALLTLLLTAPAYGMPTVESAAEHPIVAIAIAVFALTGLVHEGEMAGEVLIVLVKRLKERIRSLREIAERLKAQLSTWDDPDDPE